MKIVDYVLVSVDLVVEHLEKEYQLYCSPIVSEEEGRRIELQAMVKYEEETLSSIDDKVTMPLKNYEALMDEITNLKEGEEISEHENQTFREAVDRYEKEIEKLKNELKTKDNMLKIQDESLERHVLRCHSLVDDICLKDKNIEYLEKENEKLRNLLRSCIECNASYGDGIRTPEGYGLHLTGGRYFNCGTIDELCEEIIKEG